MWITIKGFIAENMQWLGFAAMSVVGSIVGHIKAYEKSDMNWPVKKHFWDLVRRGCYAVFIALVVSFSYQYFGVSQQIAFIVTGILSVFGSESIDWIYALVKDKIMSRKIKDESGKT